MRDTAVFQAQAANLPAASGVRSANGRASSLAPPAPQRGERAIKRRCAASAISHPDEAVSSSWFTQPVGYFANVEHPSREATRLEETFWHHPVMEVPANRDEAMVMMERLHQETAAQASADGVNVVAFTGGNGPALTAYLLNNLFDGSVVGCIGNVQALPQQHIEHAQFVADLLGFDLVEVDSQTWSRFSIPDSLDREADELCTAMGARSCEEAGLTMFSGATADDMATFTRQGREMHGIVAPLSGLSRAAVNSLSRIVGLPTFQEKDQEVA